MKREDRMRSLIRSSTKLRCIMTFFQINKYIKWNYNNGMNNFIWARALSVEIPSSSERTRSKVTRTVIVILFNIFIYLEKKNRTRCPKKLKGRRLRAREICVSFFNSIISVFPLLKSSPALLRREAALLVVLVIISWTESSRFAKCRIIVQ